MPVALSVWERHQPVVRELLCRRRSVPRIDSDDVRECYFDRGKPHGRKCGTPCGLLWGECWGPPWEVWPWEVWPWGLPWEVGVAVGLQLYFLALLCLHVVCLTWGGTTDMSLIGRLVLYRGGCCNMSSRIYASRNKRVLGWMFVFPPPRPEIWNRMNLTGNGRLCR